MGKTRGPTGTAGGVSGQMVTDILVEAVVKIQKKHGAEFKREQAAEVLREIVGHTQVERFLEQLVQVPGIVSKGEGMYRLAAVDPGFYVRHREWRFAVGRMDLREATELREALVLLSKGGAVPLSVGMAALLKRVTIALDSLE